MNRKNILWFLVGVVVGYVVYMFWDGLRQNRIAVAKLEQRVGALEMQTSLPAPVDRARAFYLNWLETVLKWGALILQILHLAVGKLRLV